MANPQGINQYTKSGFSAKVLKANASRRGAIVRPLMEIAKVDSYYKGMKGLSKSVLVSRVQSISRLDVSHLKSESTANLKNHLLNSKFGRKALDAWGNKRR